MVLQNSCACRLMFENYIAAMDFNVRSVRLLAKQQFAWSYYIHNFDSRLQRR